MYKTYCLYPQGYSSAPSMFNRGCLLAFKRQARGFQHKEMFLRFTILGQTRHQGTMVWSTQFTCVYNFGYVASSSTETVLMTNEKLNLVFVFQQNFQSYRPSKVKVRKILKKILFSISPKNQRKIFPVSALATKKWSNQKNISISLLWKWGKMCCLEELKTRKQCSEIS